MLVLGRQSLWHEDLIIDFTMSVPPILSAGKLYLNSPYVTNLVAERCKTMLSLEELPKIRS